MDNVLDVLVNDGDLPGTLKPFGVALDAAVSTVEC